MNYLEFNLYIDIESIEYMFYAKIFLKIDLKKSTKGKHSGRHNNKIKTFFLTIRNYIFFGRDRCWSKIQGIYANLSKAGLRIELLMWFTKLFT